MNGYEAGESSPAVEVVERLARELKFPTDFFYGDDLDQLDANGVSFRSMSKMTAAHRKSALGAGALALLLNGWIEQRFELPVARVPNLSGDVTPEAAADWLRQEWGLGEAPIRNLIHLLESRGVRVFSLAIDARQVDAFSFWRNETPFVFLNTGKSAERSRYDAAHELGHLVMHKHAAPNGQDAELQANEFASAFLMPRRSVLANPPKFPTVELLVELKKIWNVSAIALARRLHDVDVISDWHYHVLCREMSELGYRTEEPAGSRRETSQVLAKIMAALREDGVAKGDIAVELGVYASEIDELMFGLTLTSISGLARLASGDSEHAPILKLVSDNSGA
jgi:Zn-dependent peptidase ImmA (M78 family)